MRKLIKMGKWGVGGGGGKKERGFESGEEDAREAEEKIDESMRCRRKRMKCDSGSDCRG